MPSIDLMTGRDGLTQLTQTICDIASVSGDEQNLADVIESALRGLAAPTVDVTRYGNNIVARTSHGRGRRVILAGHIDTVPVAHNLPTQLRDDPDRGPVLWGRGTVDMKAGLAVLLQVFAQLALDPASTTSDVTLVAYDNEEVASDRNGLGHLVARHPDLIAGDFAVLGEPSNGGIEGGCNGTLRVHVSTTGVAAHSARSWMGSNAIHAAAPILSRLAEYQAETVEVDGLAYREGLNAVAISGGIAGNVIPDRCRVTVNYRFAPARSEAEALKFVEEFFAPFEVVVDDTAPGARPGLDSPLAQEFVAAVSRVTGGGASAKVGWTDVARFSRLGVPAVNFGPGDPSLAHHDEERVSLAQITQCYDALYLWLAGNSTAVH